MSTFHRRPGATVVAALLAGLGCSTLSSCGSKSSHPTAPVIPAINLLATLKRILPASFIYPTSLDTTASLLLSANLGGFKAAGAAFLTGQQLVDGGDVSASATVPPGMIKSYALTKLVFPTQGGGLGVLYSSFAAPSSPSIDLPFDGATFHRFDASGAGTIPAFLDSVRSVDDIEPTIANGTVVQRSSDLIVGWSDPGGDPSVLVGVAVIDSSDTTRKAVVAAVPDPDGTLTVTSAQLQTLPAGAARLAVGRFRLVLKMISGRSFSFLCETVTQRMLILQ